MTNALNVELEKRKKHNEIKLNERQKKWKKTNMQNSTGIRTKIPTASLVICLVLGFD